MPHGTDREPDAGDQPLLITLSSNNPNGASVRFLVDGADLPPDASSYERMVILFDGNDPEAVALARDQWRVVKGAGHEATYWQQAGNRWERKA